MIRGLIKDRILEACTSLLNTPILLVKKLDGTYQLVQDLREVNKHTITRYPVVPNPYTLLNRILPDHRWFSVIDLKDAFWTCLLAEESRDWFAFEWEDPDSGRKLLRWTRLPQGFTKSLNLFGQALEELLKQFEPSHNTQVLQYIDDLLIPGEGKEHVRKKTIY